MGETLGPIYQGEIKRLRFGFEGEIDTTAAITGVTLTATLHEGADANPSSKLVGLPTVSGLVVYQLVQAGAAGSTLRLQALAVCDDGTRHICVGFLRSA